MTTDLAVISPDNPEAIAQSIIPYPRDDERARFLGLRASGFKPKEALKLMGRSQSTLGYWRQEEEFRELEKRIPEFRRTLGYEYVSLEFLRNLRLIHELDYQTIAKSLDNPEEMTQQEAQYLNKLRSYYTPQQLQAIEMLLRGEDSSGKGFNFTDIIVEMARTTEKVRLTASKDSDETLSPVY